MRKHLIFFDCLSQGNCFKKELLNPLLNLLAASRIIEGHNSTGQDLSALWSLVARNKYRVYMGLTRSLFSIFSMSNS